MKFGQTERNRTRRFNMYPCRGYFFLPIPRWLWGSGRCSFAEPADWHVQRLWTEKPAHTRHVHRNYRLCSDVALGQPKPLRQSMSMFLCSYPCRPYTSRFMVLNVRTLNVKQYSMFVIRHHGAGTAFGVLLFFYFIVLDIHSITCVYAFVQSFVFRGDHMGDAKRRIRNEQEPFSRNLFNSWKHLIVFNVR